MSNDFIVIDDPPRMRRVSEEQMRVIQEWYEKLPADQRPKMIWTREEPGSLYD